MFNQSITEANNGVLGVAGTAIPGAVKNAPGTAFYLNPSHANALDTNPGTDPNYPFVTLAAAYAACTDGKNDVIYYVAGATSVTLSAALVWAKSYTHLIGVCAPSPVAQRARIFQISTLTGASPLITFSGSGCIFKDVYIFQGVADATSLVNGQVSGSRNAFLNVHFAGGGHATQAIDGGASLRISGGSENLFENCTVGVDTIAAATGMAALLFAATGGAARNTFRNCHFNLLAGNAGARFVETMGNAGIDRFTVFDQCVFSNLASTAMTQAFVFSADSDPANKRFLLKGDNPLIGATDWDADNRGMLYLTAGTSTGGGNAGVMLVSNSV